MYIVQYLNISYDAVKQKSNREDIVKVHLCVSHLMHNMTTDINKYFSKSSKNNKLMKEIFASIYLISDYDLIQNIWFNLFVLLKSKLR